MERREHYDPEDIEQLLMERSYDELLDEERAYVLRHLSGREEYEAMRRLLNHVQRSEPEAELLDADPVVKDHVMQLFRDQRKPQWRIWLNSVGAVLMPEEASAMWRPALALAGLALLITTGVWLLRSGDPVAPELAELRPVKEQVTEPPPAVLKPTEEASERSMAEAPVVVQPPVPEAAKALIQAPAEAREVPLVKEVMPEHRDDAFSKDLVEHDAVGRFDALAEDQAAPTTTNASALIAQDSLMVGYTVPAATNSGYMNNWSLANTEGKVALEVDAARQKSASSGKRKTEDAKRNASRSLRNDQAAISLLSAAW